jgi:broad specificity phosphatase PhoE
MTPMRVGSRIALIRHARSSHVHTGWMNAAGFRAWREAYEGAGIREDERVPAGLELLVKHPDLVLTSDAPRAIASARLIAPSSEIVVSPLLRELDLHGPQLGALRLPLVGWAVAVGARTLVETVRGRYPSEAEADRISEAATLLEKLALQHPLLLVVTHASFRKRLADRLLRTEWQAEPGPRSFEHWSVWLFRRD